MTGAIQRRWNMALLNWRKLKMAEYRVAFVGCGGISRSHVGGYKPCERTEIVAGVDLRAEQLEKWGKDVGVSALYTDLDEMLKKEKPDIVRTGQETEPNRRSG